MLSFGRSHSCAEGSEEVSQRAGWRPPAPPGVTKGHGNREWAGGFSCKSGFFLFAAF